MIRKSHFLIFLAAFFICFEVFSQGDRKDKTAVTYEEIYDEPYSVNKLFVQLQPLYGELFATNVNAGFGAEATYYHEDKADFHAAFRKTYSQRFFDFNRDQAEKTSDLDNASQIFNYFEVGGTYHVKDFEQSSKTKMFLYKNSYRGAKWAARVPLHAEVPCKVRKVYGARLGAVMWRSTVDVNAAMRKQGLKNTDFKSKGDPSIYLPAQRSYDKAGNLYKTPQQLALFSNLTSTAIYVGGSMTWIKNVAVNFDKFEEGIDDLIVTTYIDILYSPSIKLGNMAYTNKDGAVNGMTQDTQYTFVTTPIKTSSFGFRAGIEGKFNRTWGWSYGGEIGYRPSVQGLGFYTLVKIAFPVFGTNLDYKVESFGK